MMHPRAFAIATTVLALTAASSLHADVKTEEKMKFELGGMLGKVVNLFSGRDEGTVSTIAVKGPRQSTMGDSFGQIIDLSEEKVYQLDVKRKTYRTFTFAQIRQQMEEARAKAEKAMREEQAKQNPKDAQDAKEAAQKIQDSMEIDLDVRKTGQSRAINGHNTNQVLVIVTVREKGKTLDQSGGLQITSDMWMAPQIPALKEVTDFQIEYAKKLYGPMLQGASPQDMASAMALYPMLKPALERMNAEKDKVEGTAILTTVKVEAVKSAEQFALEQKQREEANKPSISGGVGGLIGGLARRAAQNKVQGAPQPRAMVMTTTSELLKIATDVPAADVAIPAGFKQQ
jgi:hypothetical protein